MTFRGRHLIHLRFSIKSHCQITCSKMEILVRHAPSFYADQSHLVSQSITHNPIEIKWLKNGATPMAPQSLSEHLLPPAAFNQINFSPLHMLQMVPAPAANLPNSISPADYANPLWQHRREEREKNLIEFSLRQFFGPWPSIKRPRNARLQIGTTEKRNASRAGRRLMWVWYSAKQCHGNDVEASIEMPSCIIRMVWRGGGGPAGIGAFVWHFC